MGRVNPVKVRLVIGLGIGTNCIFGFGRSRLRRPLAVASSGYGGPEPDQIQTSVPSD